MGFYPSIGQLIYLYERSMAISFMQAKLATVPNFIFDH